MRPAPLGRRYVARRQFLRDLLADDHAAVQAAASICLTRIGDRALIDHVLDTLHTRPPIVRVFQLRILRETWRHTVPALIERLQPLAPLAKLQVWIALAEQLGDSHCLAALLAFRNHPWPRSASRRRAHCDITCTRIRKALRDMLKDDDWRVRAQAARGLGALGSTAAVSELSSALLRPERGGCASAARCRWRSSGKRAAAHSGRHGSAAIAMQPTWRRW